MQLDPQIPLPIAQSWKLFGIRMVNYSPVLEVTGCISAYIQENVCLFIGKSAEQGFLRLSLACSDLPATLDYY